MAPAGCRQFMRPIVALVVLAQLLTIAAPLAAQEEGFREAGEMAAVKRTDLRGRDYDVTYLGYNTDGRIGRINLTASAFYAFGEDRNSIFTGRKAKIRSYFVAAPLTR